MLIKKADLCHQYTALLDRLEETENGERELSTKLIQCGQHCLELLRQHRKSINDYGFPDQDTEIYFFKHIKPAIAGRHYYYKRVYQLHLGELKGCWQKEKERLTLERDVLTKVFQQYDTLWKYCRSGGTSLDAVYFLRECNDWLSMPFSSDMDGTFCTCGDGQLAELIGSEMLMAYIARLIVAGEQVPEPTVTKSTHKPLVWTSTKADFTELVHLIELTGVLNHGKATRIEINQSLGSLWSFDVPDIYQVANKNFNRKEPFPFLKRGLELLLRFLDQKLD